MEHGWRAGRVPSPGFDTAAYLALYFDVARAGLNPLLHSIFRGEGEGRVLTPVASAS